MTPDQVLQVEAYEALIPTLDKKYLTRHKKKLRLFVEQDGLCCLCGKEMILKYGGSHGNYATFEHVQTRSSGGSFASENVPLSHGTCNSNRGVENFETYKNKIIENGGKAPRQKNKKVIALENARAGDHNAIESMLAKKLNLALLISAIESGDKPPVNLPVEILCMKLANPINLGGGVNW